LCPSPGYSAGLSVNLLVRETGAKHHMGSWDNGLSINIYIESPKN